MIDHLLSIVREGKLTYEYVYMSFFVSCIPRLLEIKTKGYIDAMIASYWRIPFFFFFENARMSP